ncbi:MAG: hypothetical protein EAZ53_06920 [Bacteroidetes bacterium]|nr:MAG: hypothetical protein EAZ53_06920 [Bacteroidota bacterium]
MRSSMVILIFLYLILVIGIVIYHYLQLKNTVEIKGQISAAQTEKINSGKMSFSITKTQIDYLYNSQKYSLVFDTDLIENSQKNEINLLVNISNPSKAYINTLKGKWLEKCYLILFFSIASVFILLFFVAKN